MSFPAGIILMAVLSVVIPLTLLLPALYQFDEGALRRRADLPAWTRRWKLLWLAGGIAAFAAFVVEFFVYEATLFVQIRWQIAAALSLLAAWADYRDRIIPNGMVAIAAVEGVIVLAVQVFFNQDIWDGILLGAVIGAAVGFLVFFISRLLTKGGVGFGDIKLYLVLGLLAGFRGVFNIMLYAMIVAFVVSVVRLATKKGHLNDTMPLAPFTFLGLVLAVAFGA